MVTNFLSINSRELWAKKQNPRINPAAEPTHLSTPPLTSPVDAIIDDGFQLVDDDDINKTSFDYEYSLKKQTYTYIYYPRNLFIQCPKLAYTHFISHVNILSSHPTIISSVPSKRYLYSELLMEYIDIPSIQI